MTSKNYLSTLQIVRDIGGFTMGRSDLLRRAMGKKKMKIMQEERQNFIYGKKGENGEADIPGAINNGVSEKTANDIYDLMIDFAKYAFPKAHSVAYAALAYETAWLKLHYPVEFMAALISSIMGNSNQVSLYIRECKRIGIEVLPPDVNESRDKFTVVGGKMRFGLAAVKNVGSNVIQDIIRVREEKGKFESFTDFCQKVDTNQLNKRQVESLIKCGAFDTFGLHRSQLIASFEKIIDGIAARKRRNIEGQFSLFDSMAQEEGLSSDEGIPELKEYNEKALLAMEKEMVGVYLSGHPLSQYEKDLEKVTTTNCSEIADAAEKFSSGEKNTELRDGSHVTIGGIIIRKQNKITKNNNMMAFVTVEDLFGTIEAIVFPKIYEDCSSLIYEDNIVVLEGTLSMGEEDTPKLMCNKMTELNKTERESQSRQERVPLKLYIKVTNREHFKSIKNDIYSAIGKSSGTDEIIIYSEKEKANMTLKEKVDASDKMLIESLKLVAGNDGVKVKEVG